VNPLGRVDNRRCWPRRPRHLRRAANAAGHRVLMTTGSQFKADAVVGVSERRRLSASRSAPLRQVVAAHVATVRGLMQLHAFNLPLGLFGPGTAIWVKRCSPRRSTSRRRRMSMNRRLRCRPAMASPRTAVRRGAAGIQGSSLWLLLLSGFKRLVGHPQRSEDSWRRLIGGASEATSTTPSRPMTSVATIRSTRCQAGTQV